MLQDKNPLVSIIVAIYKSEKFLDKLIQSAINQTYTNIELILVDDGSPDNSGKICDEYSKKDNRIKVIHKKNGGACEARNVGMEAANGEWIMIVDGDDWLETDYVEYMLNLVLSTDSEMGMSTNIFTTRDRKQIEKDSVEVWSNEKAATMILYPYIVVGPWNKIYKTELLRKNNINFSRPWSGEGLYFSCTAAQYANHVGIGHRKVYNYRLNNENSGLTHYNIKMGTNALENILYIGNHIIIDTPMVRNAVNWHIWKNYGYILFLINATNSKKDNLSLYKECRKNYFYRLPKVFLKSALPFKSKVLMLIQGLAPNYMAKRKLRKAKKALKNDLME